jgi:hypothetical protein
MRRWFSSWVPPRTDIRAIVDAFFEKCHGKPLAKQDVDARLGPRKAEEPLRQYGAGDYLSLHSTIGGVCQRIEAAE